MVVSLGNALGVLDLAQLGVVNTTVALPARGVSHHHQQRA